MMRTHTPGRPELRPRRRHDIERHQCPALGDAAQHVESGWVGPVEILECQHHRLDLGARHHPVGQRCQLPAAQFLWRQRQGALFWQRNVEQRRQQRSILGRVELDLRQRAFQLSEALLSGYVGAAEALAAPFGDRVQRRVLQKLRAAPFDPGVRSVAQPGMELFNEPRLADPRLADN